MSINDSLNEPKVEAAPLHSPTGGSLFRFTSDWLNTPPTKPSSVTPAFGWKTNQPPASPACVSHVARLWLLVEVLREQWERCLNYSKTQLPSAPQIKGRGLPTACCNETTMTWNRWDGVVRSPPTTTSLREAAVEHPEKDNSNLVMWVSLGVNPSCSARFLRVQSCYRAQVELKCWDWIHICSGISIPPMKQSRALKIMPSRRHVFVSSSSSIRRTACLSR